MLNNRFVAALILCFLAIFFYVLHCFMQFDGETIYTIDFILILSIVFYAVGNLEAFVPNYPFLADNWDEYVVHRLAILKTVGAVEGLNSTTSTVLIAKQLACTDTSVIGSTILNRTTKATLVSVLV